MPVLTRVETAPTSFGPAARWLMAILLTAAGIGGAARPASAQAAPKAPAPQSACNPERPNPDIDRNDMAGWHAQLETCMDAGTRAAAARLIAQSGDAKQVPYLIDRLALELQFGKSAEPITALMEGIESLANLPGAPNVHDRLDYLYEQDAKQLADYTNRHLITPDAAKRVEGQLKNLAAVIAAVPGHKAAPIVRITPGATNRF